MVYLLIILGVLVIAILLMLTRLQRYFSRINSNDPLMWEKEIRAFEVADGRNPPSSHPIVFTGSSSIGLWQTLHNDMAPLSVLNRGFGGAQIAQVTYYADRIVIPYDPRAIVFYAGENDIASGNLTSEQVLKAFQQFCEKIHAALPQVPIYFLSIKPAKGRLPFWPSMQQANTLIHTYCASDNRLYYIDLVPQMLDAFGKVRGDLFNRDGIHLNARGYAHWVEIVKPHLVAAFPDTNLHSKGEFQP